jgi:hypothetical protein
LRPNLSVLLEKLNELRFDKIKPVRDASLEAINALKEAPELEFNEEMITKQKEEKANKAKA